MRQELSVKGAGQVLGGGGGAALDVDEAIAEDVLGTRELTADEETARLLVIMAIRPDLGHLLEISELNTLELDSTELRELGELDVPADDELDDSTTEELLDVAELDDTNGRLELLAKEEDASAMDDSTISEEQDSMGEADVDTLAQCEKWDDGTCPECAELGTCSIWPELDACSGWAKLGAGDSCEYTPEYACAVLDLRGAYAGDFEPVGW
jgi:hypothetical protein